METLNTFQEPAADANAAHDQEMIAKAEAASKAGDERPDWLPEKFKSAEDMAKAYSELEKKLGSGGKPEETTETDEDTPAPEGDATEVAKALDNVGLDFNTFQDEYNTNGGLSDNSYKTLEEKGFTRDLVDSWIAGQEALAATTTNQIYESVGGAEQYQAMMEWAADNLRPSEIASFNKAVDSGDLGVTQLAVQGLQAKYRSEVGSEPKLIKGEGAATGSGAFQSAAELTAAMRDPRYHSDPAYRQSVADRLARSNVF